MKITIDMFLDAFSQEWKSEIEKNRNDVLEKYSSSRKWTVFMQNNGGFLNNVMDRMSDVMDYRTEYYTIDALYVGGKDYVVNEGLYYPSEIYALIEHENGERIQEEMWKLINWSAPLKIIIFYDYNDDQKEFPQRGKIDKKTWLTEKLDLLYLMLDERQKFYPENIDTQYLFLIGARKVKGGDIYWRISTNSSRPLSIFHE